MYEAKMKYTDYNDVEREESFYFHLNKTELRKLENSETGGLSSLIEKLMLKKSAQDLLDMFYKIIDVSYGEKDPDGRGFHKSSEILENFKATQAYSDFVESLLTDPNKATEFLTGVMPKEVREEYAKLDKSKLTSEQRRLIDMANSAGVAPLA